MDPPIPLKRPRPTPEEIVDAAHSSGREMRDLAAGIRRLRTEGRRTETDVEQLRDRYGDLTLERLREDRLVYVPAPGHPSTIDPGSGIVGIPTADGDRIDVYFEGNRYGSSGLERYADRVYHAASRMASHASTVARAHLPADHLVEVGWWDGVEECVRVEDEEALAEWLGVDRLEADMLVAQAGSRPTERDLEAYLEGLPSAVRSQMEGTLRRQMGVRPKRPTR